MKTESRTCEDAHASTVNVLIVYDELRSAKHAKELCDRLGRGVGSENELKLNFWSLSALQNPPLAKAAAADATCTPLLMVAVNGDQSLPPCVKSWISRWCRQARGSGGALVAQLHGVVRMNQELSSVYLCLKHIAHDAGLGFFSEVVEPSASEPDYSLEAIHERAHMRPPLVEEVFKLTEGRRAVTNLDERINNSRSV